MDGPLGLDVMTFNCASGDEVMEASAIDDDLIFTRDVGFIRMDTERLEQLDVNTLGGADTVTVGDPRARDRDRSTSTSRPLGGVRRVAGTPRPWLARRASSTSPPPGSPRPASTAGWSVDIVNSEPIDVLAIDGNGGDDVVDTSGLAPDTIQPAVVAP